MTNIILPSTRLSNITISPTADAKECLFIKQPNGSFVPVLIKDNSGNWKINDVFK